MRQKSKRLHPLLLALSILLNSCSTLTKETCARTLQVMPASEGILTLYEGSQSLFSVELKESHCADAGQPVQVEWLYDQNGNGVLDEQEGAIPVALGSEWLAAACAADRGQHLLRLKASRSDTEMIATDYTVSVSPQPNPVPPPSCYQEALDAVRAATTVTEHQGIAPLVAAQQCLAPYLHSNLCDYTATAASALAGLALFSARLPERFAQRNTLTEAEVVSMAADEIQPFVNQFHFLAEKAPPGFTFYIDGKFEITVFEDLPYLEGNEQIRVLLQGEIDRGDILAAAAASLFIDGGFQLLQAYHGVIRYLLDMPNFDKIDFAFLRANLIEHLVNDDKFLTLVPRGMVELGGAARLLAARDRLVRGIARLQEALAEVAGEQDNQQDDLLRYWDCGTDGLCPCEDSQLVFLACPNDPDDYPGPDENGTEGNGTYDRNEPVGVDRVAITNYFTLHLPANIDEFNRQVKLVQDNLIGPDPLDLDQIALVPVTWGLKAFAIPAPEIRLSQWFDSPADPRELVPLYDTERADFLFVSEGEPYTDTGYDNRASQDEVIVDDPNPRGLPLGTPWNAQTNPDPAFDDLDPICNPICNFTDGLDNDGDGLIDLQDRVRMDQLGYVVLLPQEIGVEGNLMFDFVDQNANFLHDAKERSESFRDVGVANIKGETVGAGNHHWDFADSSHSWPMGPTIAPISNRQQIDPANGVSDDPVTRLNISSAERITWAGYEGLFDPFYFFFPDPTFSGVLVFPQPVESIAGGTLTKNAVLLRFFNKIMEIGNLFEFGKRTGDGQSMPPLNLGAHRCTTKGGCR